jgi:hypothetical protein
MTATSPRGSQLFVVALQVDTFPPEVPTARAPLPCQSQRSRSTVDAVRGPKWLMTMQTRNSHRLPPPPSAQHLSRPMVIRVISMPVGVILIDCLHGVVVTTIAAVKVVPVIDTLNPLLVKRPATAPTAA